MSKRKLLLADDSITIQKVVDLTFADEGFEVISVGDGNSAMDKLREESPDLIMADVNMPGLNGYEICEKIKQGESLRDIPVILLVGSFEPFDEDEANRVGANLYLTKPFQSINQLVDSVMELISDNGADDAPSNGEVHYDDIAIENQNDIVEPVEESADFGRYETDDETIQADQLGSFPEEDMSKYETVNEVEIVEEYQMPEEAQEAEAGFEVVEEIGNNDDTAEFSTEIGSDHEFSIAEDVEDDSLNIEDGEKESSSRGSEFDLDDSSLLELSFIEPVSDNEEDVSEETETEMYAEEEPEEELISEDVEEEADFYVSENGSSESVEDEDEDINYEFSPDLIDQIVNRVVDSMSDGDMKDVASRVVRERTNSIIREIVEEKMRN